MNIYVELLMDYLRRNAKPRPRPDMAEWAATIEGNPESTEQNISETD